MWWRDGGESGGFSFVFTAHVFLITNKRERRRKEKNRQEEKERMTE